MIYAARRCRTTKTAEALASEVSDTLANNTKRRSFLLKVVHEDWAIDVAEMASLTFDVQGMPNWATVELLRHRLLWSQFSMEQVSKRAIGGYRLGIHIQAPSLAPIVAQYMNQLISAITKDGIPPETFRDCLPEGVKTNYVIRANLRAWMHFFYMRCSQPMGGKGGAHPILMDLADEMLRQAREVFPDIFETILPA